MKFKSEEFAIQLSYLLDNFLVYPGGILHSFSSFRILSRVDELLTILIKKYEKGDPRSEFFNKFKYGEFRYEKHERDVYAELGGGVVRLAIFLNVLTKQDFAKFKIFFNKLDGIGTDMFATILNDNLHPINHLAKIFNELNGNGPANFAKIFNKKFKLEKILLQLYGDCCKKAIENHYGLVNFATILNQLNEKGVDNFATILKILDEKDRAAKFATFLNKLDGNGPAPANFARILNGLKGIGTTLFYNFVFNTVEKVIVKFVKILSELKEDSSANFAVFFNKLGKEKFSLFATIFSELDKNSLEKLIEGLNNKSLNLSNLADKINNSESKEEIIKLIRGEDNGNMLPGNDNNS